MAWRGVVWHVGSHTYTHNCMELRQGRGVSSNSWAYDCDAMLCFTRGEMVVGSRGVDGLGDGYIGM